MRNFIFPEPRTQKKLPNLQFFVSRAGIERTQFLDGIRFDFLFRVRVP
jgi:hypothetical protein